METEHHPPDAGGEPSGEPSGEGSSGEQHPVDSPSSPQGGYSVASDPDDLLMCRVCRGNEGSLYYPCLCTGSIKYVHQECLVEWLKYSKKEVCELCNHKYSFQPIYRQDMPKALPIIDITKGILHSFGSVAKTWLIYTLVLAAWLGLVPLTAARIYNCIFYLSIQDIITTPVQLVKVDHVAQDIVKGALLLVIFICTFISLVWLREQIILAGPQNFLNIVNANGEAEDDEQQDDDEHVDSDDDDPEEEEDNQDSLAGELNDEEDAYREEFTPENSDDDEESDDEEEDDEDDEDDGDNVESDENADEPMYYLNGRERNLRDAMIERERLRIFVDLPANQRDSNLARLRAELQRFDTLLGLDNENDHEPVVEEAAGPAADGAGGENQNPEEQENRRARRQQREDRMAQQQEQEQDWRDWDRFGDELTWQRLLGLDGSLIFLEHVFWVISLNTLFTVVFAYLPYRVGYFLLSTAGIQSQITYYPSIMAMLAGYVVIALLTYWVHFFAGYLKFKTIYRFLGIMFLIIKVFLLVLMEIGFFPVMCGCWMNICTLPLFSVTLSQRVASFTASPFMSIFLHWMVGMVYVFYSASFVILLREILRPGVLWFMRNLNDPDFNPIQEMIDLPFTRHFRRLVVSTTLFFSTILLIFYIPLKFIHKVFPSMLPYNVSMSADTPISELSMELLILQVVMPAILDHAHVRTFIKMIVKQWCIYVGKVLDLDRYLLSDNTNNNGQNNERVPPAAAANAAANAGGLAAQHQALLLLREPRAYEIYVRPSYFQIRIAILLVFMAISTVLSSITVFVMPTFIGRLVLGSLSLQTNIHEIYTAGIGMYCCWAMVKAVVFLYSFTQGGLEEVKQTVLSFLYLGFRVFMVCIPVVFIIPLLIGLYFQLVFLAPLRVGSQQTVLLYPFQDWALGVLQMKIFTVMVMMGPDWWMKAELDLVVERGVEDFGAVRLLTRLILPFLLYLGSLITFPVVITQLYASATGLDSISTMLLLRFSYPAILVITLIGMFLRWQMNKFGELAEKIKNDRYLVGTQLVNYERNGQLVR